MMKVAVLGWYGHGNLGDELILYGLKNLFSGWQVIPVSSDSKGLHPQIDFDSVNNCDLFVLGGGELINHDCLFMLHPFTMFKRNSLLWKMYHRSPLHYRSWVDKIKIPKIILGCGVNVADPQHLKQNVIRDLAKFDFIGLRDSVSVRILKAYPQIESKVHLTYDLSFSADADAESQRKGRYAVVAPTDRHHMYDRGVKLCNAADASKAWLKDTLSSYGKTVFLAFGTQDNDDYATCERLASCAKHSVILRTSDLPLKETLGIIRNSSLMVAYRLHALILAFMLGVKYKFYPYHWKLNRIHQTITGHTPTEIMLAQRNLIQNGKWHKHKFEESVYIGVTPAKKCVCGEIQVGTYF